MSYVVMSPVGIDPRDFGDRFGASKMGVCHAAHLFGAVRSEWPRMRRSLAQSESYSTEGLKMIRNKVVFLLGAGASRGYGYPTGTRLMSDLTGVSGDQILEMEKAGIEKDDVMLFSQRLGDCGLNSVDSFLKKNPVFGRVAKMRIAQELTAAEQRAARGAGRDETWIKYLFSRFMDGNGVDEFRDNKCTFVTLNYDRCLEFELTKMLSNSYGAPWKDAAAAVGAIKTIHLHGSIGSPPEEARLYGRIPGPGEVQKAAEGILTLGEPGSEREYEAASTCLRSADVIFSLGFGYHQETLEKLGLLNEPLPVIHGTCQGLTQSEVNRLHKQFAPRQFAELLRDGVTWTPKQREPGPAVDYLRANVELLD
jgi:hypothetical protein